MDPRTRTTLHQSRIGSFGVSAILDSYLFECNEETYDPTMDHTRVRLVFDERSVLSRDVDPEITERGSMPNSEGYLPNVDIVGFETRRIEATKRLGASKVAEESVVVGSTTRYRYRLTFTRRDNVVDVRLLREPIASPQERVVVTETSVFLRQFFEDCWRSATLSLTVFRQFNPKLMRNQRLQLLETNTQELRRLIWRLWPRSAPRVPSTGGRRLLRFDREIRIQDEPRRS